MPFWWGKKKEGAPVAGAPAEGKAGSNVDEFDPNEAPSNVQTTGSVDFGDGAPSAPSMTGICQPVGSPVEAVAACFWQLAPGAKGKPRYHIDF